eukprot:sb/3474172/
MAHYNSTTPPEWVISRMQVPTILISGGNDWIGDTRDVMWLTEQIYKYVVQIIFIDKYNHDDYNEVGPPFSDILGGKDFGWALNRGQIPLISYIGENLSGSNTVNFLYRGKFILSPNTVNFLYRGKFILSLNRGVTKSGVTK